MTSSCCLIGGFSPTFLKYQVKEKLNGMGEIYGKLDLFFISQESLEVKLLSVAIEAAEALFKCRAPGHI